MNKPGRDGSQVMKQRMSEEQWTFVEQMGSGYVFMHKEHTQRIVTSQMWTGKYVLYQIPKSGV
ncbi:hypothetical protein [Paenibacillus sp. 1P07SE]|uniref:hypothetical protein n=1 Tax=Paenibacillus sp. 1P07SE TaxID=3132209 RepID=UPI0039A43A24